MKTEKHMPTNKELGIRPTKKDHARAEKIVRSAHRTVEATDLVLELSGSMKVVEDEA